VSGIGQSGRMSLRRPKPPIKGGSAPEEQDKEEDRIVKHLMNVKPEVTLLYMTQ